MIYIYIIYNIYIYIIYIYIISMTYRPIALRLSVVDVEYTRLLIDDCL